MHIIPAAGSASRIGGIPKFLLPIGRSGKPILRYHLEMTLSANLETAVMLHPSLLEFGSELINSWGYPHVRVFNVLSPTMTKTVKEAVRLSKTQERVISMSMPDTFFSNADSFDGAFLLRLRECAPSLALWDIREDQVGKVGQVSVNTATSQVQDMIDKDLECSYKYLWGMMALNRELLEEFDDTDSHLGISLKSKIASGLKVSFLETQGEYLDCGTPLEYFRAFSTNLDK